MEVVNLKLYKNDLTSKHIQECKDNALESLKGALTDIDVVGYAIVTWDKNAAFKTAWQEGDGALKVANIPQFVKRVLQLNNLYVTIDK